MQMIPIAMAILVVLLAVPAWAQSATVAVFPAGTTDPNTAMPVAVAVTYVPTCNQTPKLLEVPPLVNPTVGAYDDPGNPVRDCRLSIAPQIAALAVGTGYRAAVRLGTGVYGTLSTAFAVSAAQPVPHACDTTPVSLTTALVGQVLTIGWCHSGLNTAGAATTITGWRVYRNGAVVAQTVTAGTTNTAGVRYYSTTRAEPAPGSASFEVSALNATGESARTPALAVAVTQPAAVPVAPSRGRIQ